MRLFGGLLEFIVRHDDHRDTFVTWVHGHPGVPGPKKLAGFGSGLDPVAGSTRHGKPAGYPGSKRTGGTRTVLVLLYCCAVRDNLCNLPPYGTGLFCLREKS